MSDKLTPDNEFVEGEETGTYPELAGVEDDGTDE